MEKIKMSKSEKFLKICLQVLAIQFPDIKIKYGYDSILLNMHLVELIAETNPDANESLMKACDAIETAFNGRFIGHEELLFTSSFDDTYKSFKVDQPILTWNMDMCEEDRLFKKIHGAYLPADHPLSSAAPKEQAA